MDYATWEDEYIQTPGKIDYQEMAAKWKLEPQSLIVGVYRRNLATKRRDFWDAIYHKAREASQEALEEQFFTMVKDLKKRQQVLTHILKTGTPSERVRASDALGNVVRDLLKARGWPLEVGGEEKHNLYAVPAHPENA